MIAASHAIDAAWCDLQGVFLQGWAHCHRNPVLGGTLTSSGRVTQLTFSPRPDVLEVYPDVPPGQECGFQAYLECPAFRPLTLRLSTAAGQAEIDVVCGPDAGPKATPEFLRKAPIDRFIAEMKAMRAAVLEIGARVVGPYSSLYAERFAPECRFIGADIHAAPGVDLVVDAHRLSRRVKPGSLGGVFSLAVMEHLAAPWVVAAEINRVLQPGGLTLHLMPQAYPAHQMPNDFWRMSDDGLKVLFGPATGFEVVEAGMAEPVQIMPPAGTRYGAFLQFPLYHAYAASFILARKVADLPRGAVRWPLPEIERRSRAYPAHRTADAVTE
jgi:SAM-dependent methyltransferase